MGGSGGSSDVISNGEVYSEVSEKGESGKVGMDSGPLTMGADVVAVAASSARYYFLRRCLRPRRMSLR